MTKRKAAEMATAVQRLTLGRSFEDGDAVEGGGELVAEPGDAFAGVGDEPRIRHDLIPRSVDATACHSEVLIEIANGAGK